jgi:DNA-binding YbaB/EbfC family protein
MLNIQGLMKQAQQMQKRLADEQAKLAEEEVEGTSGGGMVKITINGKFVMTKIKIDPSLLKDNETEILEDLVMAAYNDAQSKADAKMSSALGSVTEGLNLGGLKLPF